MATFLQRLFQKRRRQTDLDQLEKRLEPVNKPTQHSDPAIIDEQQVSARLPDVGATDEQQNASPLLPLQVEQWQLLGTRRIPSSVGNERLAMSYVTEIIKYLDLPSSRIEQLKTAVAEATMNAMEHGNHYNPEKPVTLEVLTSEHSVAVRISDQGGTGQLTNEPDKQYEVPNLEAKLTEQQSPRGWGLFLIQHMVDEMHVHQAEESHTIELIVHLEGGSHVHQPV
jgi:anti-sigma regulatory factor (Ser/Thr protein kinase)